MSGQKAKCWGERKGRVPSRLELPLFRGREAGNRGGNVVAKEEKS